MAIDSLIPFRYLIKRKNNLSDADMLNLDNESVEKSVFDSNQSLVQQSESKDDRSSISVISSMISDSIKSSLDSLNDTISKFKDQSFRLLSDVRNSISSSKSILDKPESTSNSLLDTSSNTINNINDSINLDTSASSTLGIINNTGYRVNLKEDNQKKSDLDSVINKLVAFLTPQGLINNQRGSTNLLEPSTRGLEAPLDSSVNQTAPFPTSESRNAIEASQTPLEVSKSKQDIEDAKEIREQDKIDKHNDKVEEKLDNLVKDSKENQSIFKSMSDSLFEIASLLPGASLGGSGGGQSMMGGSPGGVPGPMNPGSTGGPPQMGQAPAGGLGSLMSKYETGGKGTSQITNSKGDHGGASYGKYQLSYNTGSLKEYLEMLKSSNPDAYAQLAPLYQSASQGKSGAFGQKWLELASAGQLQQTEDAYAQQHYINSAIKRIKDPELAKRILNNPALLEVFLSTNVQHGEGGGTAIFNKVANSQMSDEDIIKAVYAERGRTDGSGTLVHFRKSSADIQRGVANRYKSEVGDALALLQKVQQGNYNPNPAGTPPAFNPPQPSAQPAPNPGMAPQVTPPPQIGEPGGREDPQQIQPQQNQQPAPSGGGGSATVSRYLSAMMSHVPARYSQPNRMGQGSYDCSSFVGRHLKEAGLNVDPGMTTATIPRELAKVGFKFYPKHIGDTNGLIPGDIMWRPGHVETYAGNGMDIGAHSSSSGTSMRKHYSGYNFRGFFRLDGVNPGSIQTPSPALGNPAAGQQTPGMNPMPGGTPGINPPGFGQILPGSNPMIGDNPNPANPNPANPGGSPMIVNNPPQQGGAGGLQGASGFNIPTFINDITLMALQAQLM